VANNYFDATGVLLLKEITPVITAFFGMFNIGESAVHDEVYIACISEDTSCSWSTLLENVEELATAMGISIKNARFDKGGARIEDGGAQEVESEGPDHRQMILDLAGCLGVKAGTPQAELVARFIDEMESQLDENPDLDPDELFDIAIALDDGHGLRGIKWEGCWYCDEARLFEFGGLGCYTGRHASMSTDSTEAMTYGSILDRHVKAKDFRSAAELIHDRIACCFSFASAGDKAAVLRALGERLSIAEPPQAEAIQVA
jgi:hypothetical protein